MKGKRRDSLGRLLRTGEYQRSNGSYEYRYSDVNGKSHSVYSKSLSDLRLRENEIRRDLDDGIDASAGEITVSALIACYVGLKRTWGQNTLRGYSTAINRIKESTLGGMRVKDVKPTHIKSFTSSCTTWA